MPLDLVVESGAVEEGDGPVHSAPIHDVRGRPPPYELASASTDSQATGRTLRFPGHPDAWHSRWGFPDQVVVPAGRRRPPGKLYTFRVQGQLSAIMHSVFLCTAGLPRAGCGVHLRPLSRLRALHKITATSGTGAASQARYSGPGWCRALGAWPVPAPSSPNWPRHTGTWSLGFRAPAKAR